MKLKLWMKKNKFISYIIIVFLAAIIISNMPDKKNAVSEASCNAIFELDSGWECWATCWIIPGQCSACAGGVQEEMFNLCEAQGCFVQSSVSGNYPLGLDTVTACLSKAFLGEIVNAEKCTAAVPTGKYIYSDPLGCASHDGTELGKVCGKQIYRCYTPSDPDKICTSTEATIAALGSFLPIDDCKTRYYVVVGGGGFLALMLLLAVI